jgi:hypothetical protein
VTKINKQALLDDLTTRFNRIAIPQIIETRPDEDVRWYRVICYEELSSNSMTAKAVHFYVLDEGQGGEAAFYQDKDPDSGRLAQDVLKAELSVFAASVSEPYFRIGYVEVIPVTNFIGSWALVHVYHEQAANDYQKLTKLMIKTQHTGDPTADWTINTVDTF